MAFEFFRAKFLVYFVVSQKHIAAAASDKQVNCVLSCAINLDLYVNTFSLNNFSIAFFALLWCRINFLFQEFRKVVTCLSSFGMSLGDNRKLQERGKKKDSFHYKILSSLEMYDLLISVSFWY